MSNLKLKLKPKEEDPEFYITVYKPIAGWKAVKISRENGPEMTSDWAYATQEEAIRDGEYWAECEGLPFITPPVGVSFL
jgi:hypothetical protein